MKKISLLLVLLLTTMLFSLNSACDAPMEGQERIDEAREAVPPVSSNTIQTAVTGLLLATGVGQLDDSYDEVDTYKEVLNVTAGNGAHNLGEYLSTSYPLNQAFDITIEGKVSVD